MFPVYHNASISFSDCTRDSDLCDSSRYTFNEFLKRNATETIGCPSYYRPLISSAAPGKEQCFLNRRPHPPPRSGADRGDGAAVSRGAGRPPFRVGPPIVIASFPNACREMPMYRREATPPQHGRLHQRSKQARDSLPRGTTSWNAPATKLTRL